MEPLDQSTQSAMLENFMTVVIIVVVVALAIIAYKVYQSGRNQRETNVAIIKDKKAEKGDGRRKRLERLQEAKLSAERAAADAVYPKLFGSLAMPIQQLFGLAESDADERVFYKTLERRIQAPIREALQDFNVTFTESGVSLPETKVAVNETILSEAQNWSNRDVEDAISEYWNRFKNAKKFQPPKRAINEAARQLRTLAQTSSSMISRKQLRVFATELEQVLVKNGIYPISKKDVRLAQRPDLRELFIEVHDEAITMHGLFIEVCGKLEIYGSCQGTCHRRKDDTE